MVVEVLLRRATKTLDNWSRFAPNYERLYYPNGITTRSPGQAKPGGNRPNFHFGRKAEMWKHSQGCGGPGRDSRKPALTTSKKLSELSNMKGFNLL